MNTSEDQKKRKLLIGAERFAALSHIGAALLREKDEKKLLHLIAQTAVDLTGAEFAAFTLRPIDEQGVLSVPSEGNLFHLAAVIGVTEEQEALFRRLPLGGEGVLAPIFRFKTPVCVADIRLLARTETSSISASHEQARDAANSFSQGYIASNGLRSVGVPEGHPLTRSFLGAPLLDRDGEVRGGLLLGHSEPDQFQDSDEDILVGLAAQASVAIENARLYHATQAQAQELQAIFESIADGVTLVDLNGRIVRENLSARNLRQRLDNSVEGKQSLEKLLHAPARRALMGIGEQDHSVSVYDEHNDHREYVIHASPLHTVSSTLGENSTQQLEGYYQPRPVSGAVVVWHDVTEVRRLQYERRLYEQAEAQRVFLQSILDELPSSVYLVHGWDARLVLANRATRTVWGASWELEQSMQAFLCQHSILISQIDGRPLPVDQYATFRALRHRETVYQHQEIIRHTDGSVLPVIVNAVPLDARKIALRFSPEVTSLAENEPVALVLHQDVTLLKEAEHLKDDFIGLAAHELRNPLAVLQGLVQLLLAESAHGRETLSVEVREALESIDQASRRMGELTTDLLDVTRLQAGRLELYLEATDLIALVKRVVRRLQLTTEHQLNISTQAEYLIASVDVKRMEQVIINVLENAIKYSPHSSSVEIVLQTDQMAENAIISIQDTGIGIPVDQQSRIFGRFMRAENAQRQGIPGTGLGLYLCRELVERHGGRIWFSTCEGEGTTFFLSIPLLSSIS